MASAKRVIPGVAANVVTPLVTVNVVGVHDITIVKETVPPTLLDLLEVEVEEEVKVALKNGGRRRRSVGQAPVGADSARLVECLGLRDQDGGLVDVSSQVRQLVARRSGLEAEEEDFAGPGNAVRGVEVLLPILVGNLKSIELLRQQRCGYRDQWGGASRNRGGRWQDHQRWRRRGTRDLRNEWRRGW
ncbi:hypothetical protein HYQ46_007032 [Verticillium longisporum]|nr:hypothetical protein HYQ46_007032 [Verticillium longisporum]